MPERKSCAAKETPAHGGPRPLPWLRERLANGEDIRRIMCGRTVAIIGAVDVIVVTESIEVVSIHSSFLATMQRSLLVPKVDRKHDRGL